MNYFTQTIKFDS